jgi:hypothetical protein
VERRRRHDGDVELTVRLENRHPERALHYIAEPRGVLVNEATGGFVVRLTDEGREVIPGSVGRLPNFGHVDPNSTALLTVWIPAEIVRMRTPVVPTTEVELETHAVADDAEIEVVIGWSDTPFYPDPRERRQAPDSVYAWEKGQARTTTAGPD